MRVVVLLKGDVAGEDSAGPTTEVLEMMNAYNADLVKAGIMVGGEGLKPTSAGARVVFEGGDTSVVDGPFTEAKEVLFGYWLWQVSSIDEAVEWAKRCPADPNGGAQALELRPLFEAEDFGDAMTPDLEEKNRNLHDQIKAQHPDA